MIDPAKILSAVPTGLRTPLIQSYQEIVRNFAEHRWEPAELNGGKFCECVYTIAAGSLSGSYAASPSKPPDMVSACRALEQVPPMVSRVGDRSLRILIPRMILPLYEIRNNRGVGHVGGDVSPNYMDATAVYGMASWIMAELIRIFHGISTLEAQESADAVVERKHPLVWQIEETKRVLHPDMVAKDQALLLLYTEPGWVSVEDLVSWVEYRNVGLFRIRVLRPAHKLRLIEFDEQNARLRISPLGVTEVEKRILPACGR
jgi:hypothetical protein